MLVVEFDGGQHAEQQEDDDCRTRRLEAKGYRVLRFWNNDALTKIESGLEVIRAILASPAPYPNPLPAGAREQPAPESEE